MLNNLIELLRKLYMDEIFDPAIVQGRRGVIAGFRTYAVIGDREEIALRVVFRLSAAHKYHRASDLITTLTMFHLKMITSVSRG